MSRRIDIELTSSLADGTWTWRAAGARQPKGVLDGSVLSGDAKVGDVLKVDVEQELEGITVLGVVGGRTKQDRQDLLDLLPAEREFQPVIETRARRDRNDRGDRGDRPRRDGDRPRRDRDNRRGERRPEGGADTADRPRRDDARGGERRDRGPRDGAPREGGDRPRRDRPAGGERGPRRNPSFTPPPEVPQRPKPKRLRPGKTHRTAVLQQLPEEQRPIAELALQGMGAVRQRLREENERAVAEGRATMPEASVLKIAEELMPRLRVAEWRDRADAAIAQVDDLDLRDLRSVVVASADPIVTRDESTRSVAEQLKQVLATKQEQELQVWYGDIDAALAVGRVIRALRLSSQPPKAGVPFPTDIAQRLSDSANASLAPMDPPERWVAMLEAAAFSPIRTLIKPVRKPDVVNDELTATIARLAPALPHVAELFEVTVDPSASMPKPLRPTQRPGGKPVKQDGRDRKDAPRPGQRDNKGEGAKRAPKSSPAPVVGDESSTEAVQVVEAVEVEAADVTDVTDDQDIVQPAAADELADTAPPAPEADHVEVEVEVEAAADVTDLTTDQDIVQPATADELADTAPPAPEADHVEIEVEVEAAADVTDAADTAPAIDTDVSTNAGDDAAT